MPFLAYTIGDRDWTPASSEARTRICITTPLLGWWFSFTLKWPKRQIIEMSTHRYVRSHEQLQQVGGCQFLLFFPQTDEAHGIFAFSGSHERSALLALLEPYAGVGPPVIDTNFAGRCISFGSDFTIAFDPKGFEIASVDGGDLVLLDETLYLAVHTKPGALAGRYLMNLKNGEVIPRRSGPIIRSWWLTLPETPGVVFRRSSST